MVIKNGQEYATNYARAAAYFLGTCAPEPKEADEKAAFMFITGLYRLVGEAPEELGYKPVPDVFFAPWEQQRDRQSDVKIIRTTNDKIESLISELFSVVESGSQDGDAILLADGVKLGRVISKALAALGATVSNSLIALPSGCAGGLKKLAAVSRRNIIPITDCPKEDKAHFMFSRCVFDPQSNWVAQALDNFLSADGALVYLCSELEKRGYEKIVNKDGKRISLDYVKQHGAKKEPVKMSWGDKTHSGIEVTYEDLRREPIFVWLRMPFFKSVLGRISELPKDSAEFIALWTKTCDGCHYCVQTDKTGTRPLAAVDVNGEMKCPFYPSFSMNWRSLDRSLADNLLAAIDAVDSLDNLK